MAEIKAAMLLLPSRVASVGMPLAYLSIQAPTHVDHTSTSQCLENLRRNSMMSEQAFTITIKPSEASQSASAWEAPIIQIQNDCMRPWGMSTGGRRVVQENGMLPCGKRPSTG